MKQGSLEKIIGFLTGMALWVIVFVTAFEIACYSDFGFYQKEYEKYEVLEQNSILNMEMPEVMRVTKEMMSYLKGNREDLVVMAVIDGEEKEMFNDIEKSHMADVQVLFLKALRARWISILIVLAGAGYLLVSLGKKQGLYVLCSGIQAAFLTVLYFAAIIVLAAVIDFDKAFICFHLIFFDNDNWLLDPSISRLINLLPQGFFMDMAIRIGIIYLFLNFLIFSFAFCIKRGMIKGTVKHRTNKNSGGTYEQG